MKILFSVFLAIIAAFAVMRIWDGYGMTAVWTALAFWAAVLVVFVIANDIITTARNN